MTGSSKHPQYGRRSHSQIWTKTGGSTFTSKDLSLRNAPAGRFVDQVMDVLPPPTGEALKPVALSHLTPERIATPFISLFSTILLAFNRAIQVGLWASHVT